MNKTVKTALVVDWLTEGFGGGERVIKAIHEMYPEAPIYTSQYRPARTVWLGKADVRTGRLNILPVWLRRFTPFLRQRYFSRLDLTEYDLVISITGAEAKAVRTRDDALHVSYMHAPTQYYWTLYDDYIKNPGFGFLNPLMRLGLRLLIGPLRQADYRAAQQPDVIVANSTYIQNEIKQYYGRDSTVIWPNVDVATIQQTATDSGGERDGFIVYGRQVSWKRFDLAIEATMLLKERLIIIGDGPESKRLRKLAEDYDGITLMPRYNGVEEIVGRIRASKAFLFPSVEPFGIAPVEALAAGTPVIALRHGGSLDFIQDGQNGVFFEEQTVESLVEAIKKFNKLTLSEDEIIDSARTFSKENFEKRFRHLVEKSMNR